jgi:integrase
MAVESLAWLIARYRESRAWTALAPATRRQRELVFKKVAATAGAEAYTNVTRQSVMAGLDRRGATPFAAKTFSKALRGLFRWAAENSLIERDPTEGVRIPLPRTDGFHSWTEDEIAQFEARWPIGTRERLALTILLYTGLRRGDAVRLGRQHIKDGIITLRAGKTGTQIIIPVLPELAAIINASRTGDLAFIAGERGRPMTKESFGNWFRGACQAAGVPGSAHGLRKDGGTARSQRLDRGKDGVAIHATSGSRQAGARGHGEAGEGKNMNGYTPT